MNSRDSRRSVVLLLAALLTVLVVGAGLLWLSNRGADAVRLQGEPMTDAQAARQVVASAKQIVRMVQLQDATGGYAFVSCTNVNEPPYQVAVYMNFRLPQSNWSSTCATSRLPWSRTAGPLPRRWASTSAKS